MAPKTQRKKGKVTDHERELFENLNKEKGELNLEVIRQLLGEPDVYVDCLDDHGMTPLQHAAFKNNKELCEIFLSHGADVNCNEHDNGYTTLMFAALSGNTTITRFILEAGAKTTPINSVGRTASQMAAFVGQHQCVSLINNFFSVDDLAHYTKPQGFEKEPKLPPNLAPSLHKLMLMSNLNPVKLCQYIESQQQLFNEASRVARVLDCISEGMMKQSGQTNDVLAIKMHYLACVIRACHKWDVDKGLGIAGFIKYLLKGRESDGFPLGMEKFMRDSIQEFTYAESQLLQEIVRNIASVKAGDEPCALVILTQGINGSRSVDPENTCSACGETKASKKCSACKMVIYCSQACQKLHWFTHKKSCKHLQEDYKRIAAANKEIDEREKKLKEEEERKEKEKKEKEQSEQLEKQDESKTEDLADNSQTSPDNTSSTTETKISEPNISGDSLTKAASASDVHIEKLELTDTAETVQNGDATS